METEAAAPEIVAPGLLPRRTGRVCYALVTLVLLGVGLVLSVSDEVFQQGVALLMGLAVLFLASNRLRDIDRSGWWVVLLFVPLVHAVVLVGLAFWPGTRGPNRFGPSPRF